MRKTITQKAHHCSSTRQYAGNDVAAVVVCVKHQFAARVIWPLFIEIEHQRNDARIIIAKTIPMRPVESARRVTREVQLCFLQTEKQRFVQTRLQPVCGNQRALFALVNRRASASQRVSSLRT